MSRHHLALICLLAIVVAACDRPSPGTSVSRSDQETSVAGQPRTLRIVTRLEPSDLAGSGGGLKGEFTFRAFHAGLAARDIHENPYPVLAEGLPQLNTDTWTVSSAGTMRTVHRLRPGLTWHDATPVTSDDFVFALASYRAEAGWGTEGNAEEFASLKRVDKVDVLDRRTIAIDWKTTYPGAGYLPFRPLPRHLLQSALDRNDKDFYLSQDFWTTGYVGAGPYRLARWERGALMEGAAFEGYALGRPKIDRFVLTFNSDPNLTLTHLLADAVDMAVDRAIEFQELEPLRQQGWVQRVQGQFLLSPAQLRYVSIQARPAYVNPRALLDVRARRALLHAIDRRSLAEAMVEDAGMAAEVMVPGSVRYYPAVERAITKYAFDIRRTEQLMAELGFTRGADGIFVSPTEGRFSPEMRGVSEGQEGQDSTIVAHYFTRAGIDVALNLTPAAARVTNDEVRATFPALTTNNNPMEAPSLSIEKFVSSGIGTPERDWRGNNRLGWSHPEYDRLVDAFYRALDPNEADGIMVQMVTFLSAELPTLPMYFNYHVTAHVGSLRGPAAVAPFSTPYTNIHQWEWQ